MRVPLGATMLYATSCSLEALAIADDIAVLNAGRIVEPGPARTVYRNPQHLPSRLMPQVRSLWRFARKA